MCGAASWRENPICLWSLSCSPLPPKFLLYRTRMKHWLLNITAQTLTHSMRLPSTHCHLRRITRQSCLLTAQRILHLRETLQIPSSKPPQRNRLSRSQLPRPSAQANWRLLARLPAWSCHHSGQVRFPTNRTWGCKSPRTLSSIDRAYGFSKCPCRCCRKSLSEARLGGGTKSLRECPAEMHRLRDPGTCFLSRSSSPGVSDPSPQTN